FGRKKGVATDALSVYNLGVIGGVRHVRQIDSANYLLASNGRVRFTLGRYRAWCSHFALRVWQLLYYQTWLSIWHSILNLSRPLRAALGIRSKAARQRQNL